MKDNSGGFLSLQRSHGFRDYPESPGYVHRDLDEPYSAVARCLRRFHQVAQIIGEEERNHLMVSRSMDPTFFSFHNKRMAISNRCQGPALFAISMGSLWHKKISLLLTNCIQPRIHIKPYSEILSRAN
jgi:hypothetical protein